MEELGIPLERIGLSDHKHGIPWCAFNPFDKTGGGFGPGGFIELDSGVFNPDLKAPLGQKTDAAWKKARLRTRMDSVIAHEYEEGSGYSHDEAVERARIRSCRSPRRRGSWRGRSGTGIASGGGATEEFRGGRQPSAVKR